MVAPASGQVDVNVRLTGHSKDCDCDMNTWECSEEGTVAGRTGMTAVGKFVFTPEKTLYKAGYECLAYKGSAIYGTLAQCKAHCKKSQFLDYKARDGRTDGTHYCICSDDCSQTAVYPEYDIYYM